MTLARALLGDYALYRIWTLGTLAEPPSEAHRDALLTVRPISRADIDGAADPSLRESAWYLGDESHGFGCFQGTELVGLAFYWHGRRYRERHSLVIGTGAAKLVHIVTAPSMRGRGVAALLIARSAAAMQALGFHPLFARIWHSNEPSRRAFLRAGWRAVGWLLQINPLRRTQPWTFQILR